MAKVLIFSPVIVGKSMTGPAIRVWEFAQVLSQKHDVSIVTPNQTDIEAKHIKFVSKTDPHLNKHIKHADVLITQQLTLPVAWLAKKYGVKIILDAYDPAPLELLELFKSRPPIYRNSNNAAIVTNYKFSFRMADRIVCASEKQRDLWLGFLLGNTLITPPLYDQNNSLRQFIDVVPFGLSSYSPQKTGPGLKEMYGLSSTDHIIVWGGGIWDWFDPLSLIKAIKILSKTRSDIKLVFMGVKSPDTHKMSMCQEAIQLADSLGLTNQFVFFNHKWIPYEERHNYLLDATIGASTHFDHLETRFSFRTRMLDYIWAQLPILATEGDSFAELIQQQDLGVVVPYCNENSIAQAIISLIGHPERITRIKHNLAKQQKQFYWTSVTQPLEKMIQELSLLPKTGLKYQDFKNILAFISGRGTIFQSKVFNTVKLVLTRNSTCTNGSNTSSN